MVGLSQAMIMMPAILDLVGGKWTSPSLDPDPSVFAISEGPQDSNHNNNNDDGNDNNNNNNNNNNNSDGGDNDDGTGAKEHNRDAQKREFELTTVAHEEKQ